MGYEVNMLRYWCERKENGICDVKVVVRLSYLIWIEMSSWDWDEEFYLVK